LDIRGTSIAQAPRSLTFICILFAPTNTHCKSFPFRPVSFPIQPWGTSTSNLHVQYIGLKYTRSYKHKNTTGFSAKRRQLSFNNQTLAAIILIQLNIQGATNARAPLSQTPGSTNFRIQQPNASNISRYHSLLTMTMEPTEKPLLITAFIDCSPLGLFCRVCKVAFSSNETAQRHLKAIKPPRSK
jgi:hypothetical protein